MIDEGTLTKDEVAEMKATIGTVLEDAYIKSKTSEYDAEDWVTKEWEAVNIID